MYSKRNKYIPSVDDIQFCVDALNKSRVISSKAQELPPKEKLFSSPQFQVGFLQELQLSLHECKSQLNTYKREDWRLHTNKRNLVANLMFTMRSNETTELMIQSWPKLWEMLHKYELVPQGIDHLNSVHLCEAPGAFVSSLNHFLKQKRPAVSFNWVATSLNPYYEDMDPQQVINDDRIIQHTMDHWVFGPDNTGNLFNPDLVDELKKRSREIGEILLVTADGSQDNIQSAESVVADLLRAEALAALKVLSRGGHFVIKIFTAFECPTINLVYLLCCSFDEVHLFKPVSSREASSETYLVCKGFRYGRDDEDFQSYLKTIEEGDSKSMSMFPLDCISKEFQKQLLDTMRYFVAMQAEVIDANIASFPLNLHPHEWNRRKFIREEIEKRFLKAYPVEPLAEDQKLCPYVERQLEKYEIDNSYLGSWEEENVLKVNMTDEELKTQLREDFQIVKHSFEWPHNETMKPIRWTALEGQDATETDAVKIIRGGASGNIRNSRFITKRLLNFFHDVLRLNLGPLETQTAAKDVTPDLVYVTLPLAVIKSSLRCHEDVLVDQLLVYLRNVTANITLVFTNVLFIGQRSLGLLYLMSKILQGTDTQITLTRAGELMFTNLTPDTAEQLVKELEKWQPLMQDNTIRSFVDIRLLRKNEPDGFYDLVKAFNVFSCVQICEKLFE